jgi:hypothetical protein
MSRGLVRLGELDPKEPSVPTPPTPKTVALRIELLAVVPLVWRRVLVAEHGTLVSLHHYLQWVLTWNYRSFIAN